MKTLLKCLIIFSFLFIIYSCKAQQSTIVDLWDGAVPNSIKNTEFQEIKKIKDSVVLSVEQVSKPTLTVFKPEHPNGTSIVICPGGGYHHLAVNKEGIKVAKWLNSFGVTAFVLKYRLPSDKIMIDKTIGPLQDAQEAIRFVRRNVNKWGLDTKKIGIMGFSAGGHLAATLSTQFDKSVYKVKDSISAKPNFSILIYPVISMQDTITHQGSKTNLLGDNPSEEKVIEYSNEKQVTTACLVLKYGYRLKIEFTLFLNTPYLEF